MAHTLFVRDGDQLRAASAQEVLDRAAALMAQRFRTGAPVLGNPDRTRQYLRHQIGTLPYEVFGLLLLDTRHRLIRAEILFRATIAGASVHPREVARVVARGQRRCGHPLPQSPVIRNRRAQPGRRAHHAPSQGDASASRRPCPGPPHHRRCAGVLLRRDRAFVARFLSPWPRRTTTYSISGVVMVSTANYFAYPGEPKPGQSMLSGRMGPCTLRRPLPAAVAAPADAGAGCVHRSPPKPESSSAALQRR